MSSQDQKNKRNKKKVLKRKIPHNDVDGVQFIQQYEDDVIMHE